MPSRVRPPRKPHRLPGLWASVALALAVHAGIGLALFWDDGQPRGGDPASQMGAAPSPEMEPEVELSVPEPEPAPEPAQPPQPPPSAEIALPEERRRPDVMPTDPPLSAAVQPSFDCRLARSVTEKLICSDAELARLDRDLGRLYARAKAASGDAAAFRRQQQVEWRRREQTCKTRDCLIDWYAYRRRQLNDILGEAKPG
jgi:hypothetical protein